MAKQGKRLRKAYESFEVEAAHTLKAAVDIVKRCAGAKFDETFDVALRLNLDPRKSDQGVRNVVQLPAGTGKDVRVAVFARGPKAQEALDAGADIVGAEDLMETIQAGKLDFDYCAATPDMMGIVGRLGKVLGPRGLMPNPKLGGVTMDIGAAVKAAKGGQLSYRSEKAGVVHAGIGRVSFKTDQLVENMQAFLSSVMKSKPSVIKGSFVQSLFVSSSMGVSVRVDLTDAFEGVS